MNSLRSRLAPAIAGLLLVGFCALPATASSMREFEGEVQKITSKYLIVDNRMGDKIKFEYSKDETVVEGEASDWDSIKRKQWVIVSSKMLDKPRVAYKVVVQPPREDDD